MMQMTKRGMAGLENPIFALYNGRASRYKADRVHANRLVEEECR
jgi:hypothetical protein